MPLSERATAVTLAALPPRYGADEGVCRDRKLLTVISFYFLVDASVTA